MATFFTAPCQFKMDKLFILITMLVCMGCDLPVESIPSHCEIMRSWDECTVEVACPGDPEDDEYYCPEGGESYYKQICKSEECNLFFEEVQGSHKQQNCPDVKTNSPENCYLECWCGE